MLAGGLDLVTFASHTAPMRWLISKLFFLGTFCLIALIAIGFLGFLHPALDAFSHARAHLSALLALAAVLASVISCRIGKLALAGYLIAFFAFATTLIGYPLSAKVETAQADQPIYSLLHFNILWSNRQKDDLIDWIIEKDPDFISVTEASRRWKMQLKALDTKWPNKLDCDDQRIRGGLIIYSKYRFANNSRYCSKQMVFGSAKVSLNNGQTFDFISTHFRWPWPRSGFRQAKIIKPTFEQMGPLTVLAGDFNATPWSHQVQSLAKAGNLEIVPGIGPSWLFRRVPESLAAIVGIPIDHAMVGSAIRVIEANRGPRRGSDHFPYLMKFQVLK